MIFEILLCLFIMIDIGVRILSEKMVYLITIKLITFFYRTFFIPRES